MHLARPGYVSDQGLEFEERVVNIWRCSTVVKGGRRFSFGALVVVGNGAGVVGWGYGKAKEVPTAIEKAVRKARKQLVRIPLDGDTIPHEVIGRAGAAKGCCGGDVAGISPRGGRLARVGRLEGCRVVGDWAMHIRLCA